MNIHFLHERENFEYKTILQILTILHKWFHLIFAIAAACLTIVYSFSTLIFHINSSLTLWFVSHFLSKLFRHRCIYNQITKKTKNTKTKNKKKRLQKQLGYYFGRMYYPSYLILEPLYFINQFSHIRIFYTEHRPSSSNSLHVI